MPVRSNSKWPVVRTGYRANASGTAGRGRTFKRTACALASISALPPRSNSTSVAVVDLNRNLLVLRSAIMRPAHCPSFLTLQLPSQQDHANQCRNDLTTPPAKLAHMGNCGGGHSTGKCTEFNSEPRTRHAERNEAAGPMAAVSPTRRPRPGRHAPGPPPPGSDWRSEVRAGTNAHSTSRTTGTRQPVPGPVPALVWGPRCAMAPPGCDAPDATRQITQLKQLLNFQDRAA